MAAVLGGLILLLVMAGTSVYYGWIMVILWGWFVVPLGLPAIGIAHAIGISTFIGMYRHVSVKAKSEDDWLEAVSTIIVKPLFALAFGYVAQAFMGR